MKVLSTGRGPNDEDKTLVRGAGDDVYIVKYDKVITMSEVKDKMIISMYQAYCEEGDFDFGTFVDEILKPIKKSKVTKKGYISTVEDARKKLKISLKILKTSIPPNLTKVIVHYLHTCQVCYNIVIERDQM